MVDPRDYSDARQGGDPSYLPAQLLEAHVELMSSAGRLLVAAVVVYGGTRHKVGNDCYFPWRTKLLWVKTNSALQLSYTAATGAYVYCVVFIVQSHNL